MGSFKHGTSTSEVESKIKGMTAVKSPVVCVGTAPINMGDISCINKPVVIYTAEEAAEYFGGANKIDGFSISEFLHAAFNIFKVQPIICINVLDPSKHKKPVTKENITLDPKKIIKISEIGLVESTLKIKKTGTEEAVEYDGYFENDGSYIAEISTESVTAVDLAFDKLDPAAVTEAEIIGGTDLNTLAKTGLEVVNEIFSLYSMIPSVTITPGYFSDEVRAALDAKTSNINGKWGSMSMIDMPYTLKYGETVAFKKEHNWIDSDQIIMYGKCKLGEDLYHQSILASLLKAQVDGKNDGVPFESPSNKNIKASGIGYLDGDGKYLPVNLDENQANLLNENGISTVLRRPNGTVFWGNRTSIFQPGGETDPKETFIPYKAMMKYIANTVMINTEEDVDKPMTFAKAESIKTNINLWLAGLTNAGKLYGARVEFDVNENPDIIQGRFVWHIYLGFVTPGESLHYILEYDSNYASLKLFS